MRIAFAGTPPFAAAALSALLEAGHEIPLVLTQPDRPSGRGMKLKPSAVKEVALRHGIPVLSPVSLSVRRAPEEAEEALAALEAAQADVLVVAAYGLILPQRALDAARGIGRAGDIKSMNIHGSLLPRWRGAAPIQWAVIAGDEKAGVTTMLMAEGLDTGDMLLTSETPVGARETAGELFDRLAQSGAELLTETLVRLDEITPRPQNDAESCYAHMLDKKMAVIDWSKSARELDCLVRGLNPWPIALTSLAGERLKIYAAEPADGCGEPGTVLEADPKKGLTVACGEGALTLTEIQLVGGRRMKATDFLRGHAVEKGSRLGE